jgi:hypothetical protein
MVDAIDMVEVVEVVEVVDMVNMVDVLTAVSFFVLHAINFCIFERDIAVKYLMTQIEHSSGHAVLAAQAKDWPRIGLVERKR